jgi:hypothetical protein
MEEEVPTDHVRQRTGEMDEQQGVQVSNWESERYLIPSQEPQQTEQPTQTNEN